MRIKKWIMKQQWRIIQIRGIWGLFYGILLLAYAYFDYVPLFSEMDSLGPFAFAAVLLLVFIAMGYVYDRLLILWAPSQEVTMERNPYQYVPSPQDHIFWFPLYSSLLNVLDKIGDELEIDKSSIDETRKYYHELSKLKAIRKEDIEKAKNLREIFTSKHRLSHLEKGQNSGE